MPHYFFNFHDGETLSTDESGLDLPNAEEAYLEAMAGARAMWPELLGERTDPSVCAFEITDQQGALLFRVRFAELIENCRTPRPRAAPVSIVAQLAHGVLRTRDAADALQSEFREARRHLGEANHLLERLHRVTGSARRMTG